MQFQVPYRSNRSHVQTGQPPARNGKDYPWPIPACFRVRNIPNPDGRGISLCARCNRRGLQPAPCHQI